jgi:acyl phosphate:glycerol-3-phosphate acyltransferase
LHATILLTQVSELLTQPSLGSRVLAVVVAYLLGSVPFGLVLAKWVKGVDLRAIGSGNIGATNASRAMGRKWGLTVFALDFLKGWAPVYCCNFVITEDEQLQLLLKIACGTAAVLGHCYPIYLKFKGGKGVATGCGAIVAISFWVFFCGGAVWLLVRYTTRYAGLASIMMGFAFPIAAWLLPDSFMMLPSKLMLLPNTRNELVVAASLLTFLILMRHRPNIRRMLAGTEPRAGEKPTSSSSEAARHHG